MKTLLSYLLCVGLVGNIALCSAALAEDKTTGEQKEPVANQKKAAGKIQAFLGLGVGPVPPALASQLESALDEGRGVLIAEVAEDSPAEKAGLKPHDVLVSYDDQKLLSPEQLVKLVHDDKPNRQVTMGIIRGGKPQEVKVQLGEQQVAVHRHVTSHRPLLKRPWTREERNSRWDTFDAMTLSRLDGNRFKAEIKYRDEAGQVETHTFEGTRDEIRQAIDAEKRLPANEREHLRRALDMPTHPFEFEFPGIRVTPSGEVIWDFENMPG